MRRPLVLLIENKRVIMACYYSSRSGPSIHTAQFIEIHDQMFRIGVSAPLPCICILLCALWIPSASINSELFPRFKRTLTFITFAPSFTALAAFALAAFFAGHGVHVVAGEGDRARRAGGTGQSLENASQKLQTTTEWPWIFAHRVCWFGNFYEKINWINGCVTPKIAEFVAFTSNFILIFRESTKCYVPKVLLRPGLPFHLCFQIVLWRQARLYHLSLHQFQARPESTQLLIRNHAEHLALFTHSRAPRSRNRFALHGNRISAGLPVCALLALAAKLAA